MKENGDKIILDLCGGTGAWSKPYNDAGYDVRVITLPDWDVTASDIHNGVLSFWGNLKNANMEIKLNEVYGILAAPPCTMFSFTRTKAKKPRDLEEGMECVRACLNIIWHTMEVKQDTRFKKCPLEFWALENPYHGFLKKFLGKPVFTFDPWEFGDGYQKRTAIWGYFNEPTKKPVPMTEEVKKALKGNRVMNTVKFDYLKSKDIHPEVFRKFDRQTRRAITPQGFAKAFYNANK